MIWQIILCTCVAFLAALVGAILGGRIVAVATLQAIADRHQSIVDGIVDTLKKRGK